MSKLSIPIKAFQFPKTCKKPLQDLEESPLKKKKRLYLHFKAEQSVKNTPINKNTYHLISISTQSKLNLSSSEPSFTNTFAYPVNKPYIKTKQSKKLNKKYRFNFTSENFPNFSFKKSNLSRNKPSKVKRDLSQTKSLDLNESFTIIKPNLKPSLKNLRKTEDLFILTKPKKKIHAWIPQAQSFMDFNEIRH